MNLLEYFRGDEMAASVWKDKYAAPGEETPDDMHLRMAKEVARKLHDRIQNIIEHPNFEELSEIGKNTYRFLNNMDLKALEMYVYSYFREFEDIIPQGSIMSSLGRYDIVSSISNCFVIGEVADSYGGILYKDQELAQLMKRRGGVGLDISNLRPEGVGVNNVAKTSTGAVSFMHRFSNTTREVAQGGRRGALMITIDCRHPDVLEFIKIKRDKTQVTGANISVQLRDDFMEAVKADGDYLLRWPCYAEPSDEVIIKSDSEESLMVPINTVCNYDEIVSFTDMGKEIYVKKVKARKYYEEISQSAWLCAEPGQMFKDRHLQYSPDGVYSQYRFITTNPCGEIGMGTYDACRLLALNLFSIVEYPFTKEAFIDYESLKETAYIQQLIADIIVDLELEHIDRIIAKITKDPEPYIIKEAELDLWDNIRRTCEASRRTGCGFTALGDMLAALNVSYNNSKDYVEHVMKTKFLGELQSTIDMSILFGSFTGYDDALEFDGSVGLNAFFQMLITEFPHEVERMRKFGRRNVSWSTVAPTGTVSVMTQTTSGIEPLFSPFYTRRRKINPADKNKSVDFVDQNGDKWTEYPVFHEPLKRWIEARTSIPVEEMSTTEAQEWFDNSPWKGSTAPELDWEKRLEIQSIVQKYTTHSISSTINLPKDIPLSTIESIYMRAYDLGLKGVTVYRDGSRSGVLITDNDSNIEFDYVDAVKRPKVLPVEIHTTVSKGIKWNVIVGLYNGKPYEVFALPYFTSETNLELMKKGKGRYDLMKGSEVYSEDITAEMPDEQDSMSRMISTSLRHRADIKYITEQLNKTKGDITSFSKAIARVLKKYIPEGSASTLFCLDCGSQSIIFEEGCQKCTNCGSSKCG